MALTTYSCCATPTPLGVTPFMYIGRNDSNQIALLDTLTASLDDFCIYQTHPFTGDAGNLIRTSRKKVHRIKVYGNGTLVTAAYPGYLFVTADNVRSDTYLYSPFSADAAQGILWAQELQNLVARNIVITLLLQGTGINITEIEVQFTPVN